jgi:hypothetical protein
MSGAEENALVLRALITHMMCGSRAQVMHALFANKICRDERCLFSPAGSDRTQNSRGQGGGVYWRLRVKTERWLANTL